MSTEPKTSYNNMAGALSNLTLGGRPALGALLFGGAGALGSGILGQWLAKRMTGGVPLSEDRLNRIRRRFRIAGGLLAASPWLYLMGKNVADKGVSGLWKPAAVDGPTFIPAGPSIDIIHADRFLAPGDKAFLTDIFDEAGFHAQIRKGPGGKLRGLLTTEDLVAGAVGAGLGYVGGNLAGSLLGNVFALPPTTVRKASRAGALAGLLYGTGIVGK